MNRPTHNPTDDQMAELVAEAVTVYLQFGVKAALLEGGLSLGHEEAALKHIDDNWIIPWLESWGEDPMILIEPPKFCSGEQEKARPWTDDDDLRRTQS